MSCILVDYEIQVELLVSLAPILISNNIRCVLHHGNNQLCDHDL